MIEKKRPRKLNSSKDSRVRGADEMYDALNVQVSSDYDGDGSDEDGNPGGNVGVLKPAYGNSVNQYFEQFAGQEWVNEFTPRVVGNVVDNENDVIYYFVWSFTAKEQGIYAYDPKGFLPISSNNDQAIKAVYKSPIFNFPSDGFVKGDVVVLQDESQSISSRPIIYFTDGVNEPRSINVLLAYDRLRSKVKVSDGGASELGAMVADDYFDIQDFIHTCPKTPVHPPKAFFQNDPNSRTSNFEGISGYQFAYQYIYEGGEESALSTYSDIIIPPAYIQQGAKPSANLSQTNECIVKIPRGAVKDEADTGEDGFLLDASITAATSPSDLINRYIPKNVKEIRLLVREGNTGTFSIIDTIPSGVNSSVTSDAGVLDPRGLYTDLVYTFRNDRVKTGFPKSEVDKPFDNVPQRAGAQTVASNRLMYGDYVTGYDNVDVSAKATITYNSRPEDFKIIDITVRPTIDLLNQGLPVNNRKVGIYFDVENFPADNIGLSDNTTIDFTITVRPKRNWHIYNSEGSFHGSRHIGNLSPNPIEESETESPGNPNTKVEPYEVSPNLASDGIDGVGGVNGEPGGDGRTASRTNEFSNRGLNSMWGANDGVTVGGVKPKWKTVASQYDVDVNDNGTVGTSPIISGDEAEVPARYGTSAANPFILRGRPLLFSVSIKVKTDLSGSNYKQILRDFISRAITWDQDNVSLADQFNDPQFYYINNSDFPDGTSPYLEILDIKNEYSYTIDEGLDGGSANSSVQDVTGGANRINVTTKGDDRKHLIIAVGNGNVVKKGATYSSLAYLPPCGYFIVNKATPTFRLKSRDNLPNTSLYGVLQLDLRSLTDVETLTCVPFIDSDLWLDKAMKIRNDDSDNASNNPRGPEDTVYWWTAGLFEGGRFSDPDNWGLRNATIWQFQTMVVDSWYCFSKEYLVRNTMPEFLFTPLFSDYNQVANGFTLASAELVADLNAGVEEDDDNFIEVGDAVGEPGELLPEVTNGGVLKNAAVVKQEFITDRIHYNALGLGGDSDSRQGTLHFRHNMRLRVGGDGFYPGIQHDVLEFGGGNGSAYSLNLTENYEKGRARIIGWIDSGLGYQGDEAGVIYNTGDVNTSPNTNFPSTPWEGGFTILDGAGGIGANPSGGEATLRYDKGLSCAMGTVNGMMIFTGYIGPRETVLPSKIKDGAKPPLDLTADSWPWEARYENYFNKFGQDCMMPFLGQFNYIKLSDGGGYFWRPDALESITSWPANDVNALYYTTPLDLPASDGGQVVLSEEDGGFANHDWRDDYLDQFSKNQPSVEILDVGGGTVLADEIRSGGRSFKTRANHSFGIVFYDERGRAGRVNPIYFDTGSSLYVQGYAERGGEDSAGRVKIQITLDDVVNRIPDWARHYQIVYAGNSTYSNFVQYSTGGAFVASFNEGEAEQDSQNIYVSLNYLQGNKDVSYTEAFGAVSPSGTKQMYVHTPGDKLRVISYFVSNPIDDDGQITGREFPVDYEFEIVGVETLSGNPESNPLRRAFSSSEDSAVMSDAKTGQFLVLKNNPFAAGFSYDDVKNGENDPSSNKHFWNNVCVVEINSPSKEVADDEQRLYYEMGRVYDVGISDGTIISPNEAAPMEEGRPYYKTNPILLEKGDVWFRRVPLAVAKFDTDPESETFGRFRNLITYDKDNEVGSTPRFQNYFLETKAFNDTFSGNDVLSKGKPNIIDDEFGQSRNKSSITFSDKHVYNKSKLRFSSFKEQSFKDFPAEHGPIRYLMDNYDSIVMIQERKTSAIPVERSILSTADGSNSLVQNKEPLGIQSFYAGDYGCDKNPESVIRAGGVIYFASPKSAEVYRLSTSGGIEVISSLGLKSEFYKTFRYVESTANSNNKVYVPTGYDPINDEFLITIRTESFIPVEAPVETQGQIGPVVEDTGEDIFGVNVEAISGCTNSASTNYELFALEDDDSCFVLGCDDNTAVNYVAPPADNVRVEQCTPDSSETVVDGDTYENPFDCACRYFNPCIFDAFSLIPDGKVTYSDVTEFNDFIVDGATFVVPNIEAEYYPTHNVELFTEGAINQLGLDFVWAANLGTLPPASLAPGGEGFSLDETDEFSTHAYYFAVAAYTEGPSVEAMNAYDTLVNNNPQAVTGDSIEKSWSESQDVELNYDTGVWTDVESGNPIWQTAWSQAPSKNSIETFNGSSDACEYVGCTDPDAINYDPSAVISCNDDTPPPVDFRLLDPDGGGGTGIGCGPNLNSCTGTISGCNECVANTSSDCVSACCPEPIVTHRFYCLENQLDATYGYTNIDSTDDTYGFISYLINGVPDIWENMEFAEQGNAAGAPAGSLYYPSDPPALKDEAAFYFGNKEVDPPYSACPPMFINYVVDVDCENDVFNPEPNTDYYYYIGCCQYLCSPVNGYAATADGTIDTSVNPSDEEADQFEGDFDLVDGRPPCQQGLYPSDEYANAPNPDFDYNPNVSGNQP